MTRAQREAARLLDMIRQAGAPVPEGARFEQTYAPQSSRVEGGAVWVTVDQDGWPTEPLVCSQWPRRTLLRTGVRVYQQRINGDWIVDPQDLGKILP